LIYIPTITYLDMSENKITILKTSSFVNYKNLVSLTIDKNPLSSIDGNAFIGLERLQLLSMQNNKLDLATSYHQDVFRPLYSLKKLDIRSNFSTCKLGKGFRKFDSTTDM
jgi:hypothetical protein